MSMNYTQEKLWQAVHLLVTADEPIRKRLAYAAQYLSRVYHVGSPDRAFTGHPELQERFERLMERLTSTPAVAHEGTIGASTNALTDADAAQSAEEIFSLFCAATDLADVPVGFEPRKEDRR
jgi:hypothetical protein